MGDDDQMRMAQPHNGTSQRLQARLEEHRETKCLCYAHLATWAGPAHFSAPLSAIRLYVTGRKTTSDGAGSVPCVGPSPIALGRRGLTDH